MQLYAIVSLLVAAAPLLQAKPTTPQNKAPNMGTALPYMCGKVNAPKGNVNSPCRRADDDDDVPIPAVQCKREQGKWYYCGSFNDKTNGHCIWIDKAVEMNMEEGFCYP